MSHSKRTTRDRDYSEILKKHGPLTNIDLCKLAAEHPHFSKGTSSGIEKDVDRFVKHYEYLEIVRRNNGRIEWRSPAAQAEASPKEENTAPVAYVSPSDAAHEAVQKLLRGMANGSIMLKDKSPHKDLNRIKGDIYDKFMADIDLYTLHGDELGVASPILVMRIYNMALKLRAYGFIEERNEQPHTAQGSRPN